MSEEPANPECPECGKEMECKKLPELGTPAVGFCPTHGMSFIECDPTPE